jgi:type II secretory pathway component GspD/PulD (secretin)
MWAGLMLLLWLLTAPRVAESARTVTFAFENEELSTVIRAVSSLTGMAFLFDPEQVSGKITLFAPRPVTHAEAIQLLTAALALHGYTLSQRTAGFWTITPVHPSSQTPTIEVVPLQYARAEEVAYTLSQIAPPGVRIAPYPPTNSVLIAGPPRDVAALTKALPQKPQTTEPPP